MGLLYSSTVEERARPRLEGTRGAALLAIGGYVAVRLLVLLWLWIAASQAGHDVGRLLTKWDARWYASIAEHGYGLARVHQDGRVLSDFAFFPLLPWMERLTSSLTGMSHADSGLLVSTIAGLASAGGIFAVTNHVLGPRAAVMATVLWAAVPIGVVQSMAYSESLFTAVAAWALFAVIRERWLTAAALACAAGLARPSGVAVVVAVLIPAILSLVAEWRSSEQRLSRFLLDRRLAAAILAPLGWLGYLGWVGRQRGSLLGYFEVTSGWGNAFDGGIAFARWVGRYLTGPTPGLGVLLLLGLMVLALLVWKLIRQHAPLPLLVFTVVLVALAMTTAGYFGSKPRFLLPAFPLLFPIACWLASRRTPVGVGALAAGSILAAGYGAVWLLGPGPP